MSHVVWKTVLQFYYFSTEFLEFFVDISTIYKGGVKEESISNNGGPAWRWWLSLLQNPGVYERETIYETVCPSTLAKEGT